MQQIGEKNDDEMNKKKREEEKKNSTNEKWAYSVFYRHTEWNEMKEVYGAVVQNLC